MLFFSSGLGGAHRTELWLIVQVFNFLVLLFRRVARRILKYLFLNFGTVLSILMVLASLFGAVLIFIYLFWINRLSLFPSVFSNSGLFALISISIAITILYCLYLFVFRIPKTHLNIVQAEFLGGLAHQKKWVFVIPYAIREVGLLVLWILEYLMILVTLMYVFLCCALRFLFYPFLCL